MMTHDQFHLDTKLIDLNDMDSIENSPSPFGTFCIIYDGKIISHHPISNIRFISKLKNIIG